MKLQTNIPHEHGHKNPNKILLNQTHCYIKRIIYHDQVGFISRIQIGLTLENQ